MAFGERFNVRPRRSDDRSRRVGSRSFFGACLERGIEKNFGSIVLDHAPVAEFIRTEFTFHDAKRPVLELESGPVATVVGLELDEAAGFDEASDRCKEAGHRPRGQFVHHALAADRSDAAFGNLVNNDVFAEPNDRTNRAGERRCGSEITIGRRLFVDAARDKRGFGRECLLERLDRGAFATCTHPKFSLFDPNRRSHIFTPIQGPESCPLGLKRAPGADHSESSRIVGVLP